MAPDGAGQVEHQIETVDQDAARQNLVYFVGFGEQAGAHHRFQGSGHVGEHTRYLRYSDAYAVKSTVYAACRHKMYSILWCFEFGRWPPNGSVAGDPPASAATRRAPAACSSRRRRLSDTTRSPRCVRGGREHHRVETDREE